MSENNSNSQKSTEDKVTATLVSLEEDDEFEDFPVEDWADGDTNVSSADNNQHLWEEQWDDDDDDTDENFSAQLREELNKTESIMKT